MSFVVENESLQARCFTSGKSFGISRPWQVLAVQEGGLAHQLGVRGSAGVGLTQADKHDGAKYESQSHRQSSTHFAGCMGSVLLNLHHLHHASLSSLSASSRL